MSKMLNILNNYKRTIISSFIIIGLTIVMYKTAYNLHLECEKICKQHKINKYKRKQTNYYHKK
ncbi:hypothetical protein [Candidatus Phytoplasma ziziphi]|uniref:hypothetical protein n=1 Tax=Candidatus Phytoplasma TaxID=33926 RepID=UPI0012600C43|nr:hypothetical protein [Candidatus Phytoplasma ziziphi]